MGPAIGGPLGVLGDSFSARETAERPASHPLLLSHSPTVAHHSFILGTLQFIHSFTPSSPHACMHSFIYLFSCTRIHSLTHFPVLPCFHSPHAHTFRPLFILFLFTHSFLHSPAHSCTILSFIHSPVFIHFLIHSPEHSHSLIPCTHALVHTCTQTHTHTGAHTCEYRHTHAHSHITQTHIPAYIHMHTCTLADTTHTHALSATSLCGHTGPFPLPLSHTEEDFFPLLNRQFGQMELSVLFCSVLESSGKQRPAW